ncbi:transcription initiation factor TFIIF subunit beta [Pancytospora epiphaga]|nr:transcription initiation factor TFIIF subunit beta [Pancytospora epiphaga]
MKIDTSNKGQTLWLVRIPRYLADKILASNEELIVGTLGLDRGVGNSNNMRLSFTLSDTLASTGIPIEHKIDVKDKEQKMFLLRGLEDDMVVEGQISKECFIKPLINEQYLAYKRRQRLSSTDTVKIIDYFMEARKGEKYGSLKEMEMMARNRKIMLQEKKRERLDSQDVYDMIFNAYEKRPLWTVKDLADFTGQPTAYIQELIADICVLNKKDHRHAYELKPEYKDN